MQNLVEKEHCHVFSEGQLPEKEEHYDMIFALDVLEHIKNPEIHVAKLRKMLKRNGTLVAQIAPKGMFQPQHIAEIDLNQHGFLQTDTYVYVRTDSDMAVNYAKTVQGVKDRMSVTPMKGNDK
jgi:cyclopropane fatty-acyl-phospholipid synthase-like methyltransferase